MIYISFAKCENNYRSQHETALALLDSAFKELGFSDYEIKKDKNGRPYTEIENIDFSISHCKEAVLVGILTDREIDFSGSFVIPLSALRLGIDLEEIDKSCDLSTKNKIAKRFLCCEVTSIEEFYKLWTRKEAYGKMTGEGVLANSDIPCNIYSFTKCWCE